MYDVIIFTENTDPIQISIPLGGYKIASVLRKNGFTTLVVNHLSTFSKSELKLLLDSALGPNTKAVGFSTTFFRSTENNDYSLMSSDSLFPQGKEFEEDIISYIKTKNNDTKIIVGGAWTSPECANTNIDYVFMGYSEASISNFMDHVSTGAELLKSKINQHGITIVDDRVASSYDFTSDRMVWQKSDVLNHKVLPIEIGRGCIFKCKFCSYPLNGKKSLDYIKCSDIIYEELLDNYNKFGTTHYFIIDDTFNDSVEKLTQLKQAIERLPFQPKFWCYARLDLICTNPIMIELLYAIGVRGMYFGIETLDRESGRIVGKGYDREKQIAMIKHIRENYPDVSMHGSFISGLPKESYDSLQLTCNQLMNGEIPLHSWMMKPLFLIAESTISFTSDLNANYEKYGYKAKQITDSQLIIWENESTSYEEAASLAEHCIEVSRTKNYFHVPSHDSFELVNFGYDLETTMSTSFNDFRWDIVKSEKVADFILEYKRQLFNELNAQVVEW